MFFPIGDDNSARTRRPYINYLLLAINIIVFIWLQRMGSNDAFTLSYATVPGEIISGQDMVSPILGKTPISVYLTLFTAMFMHGGFAHLFGNMMFLWIFGDNLENRMGHMRYLAFYLLCGVLASLAHVFYSYYFGKGMGIPSLGASGAISGVMGGYLILFPRNQIRVIIFYFVRSMSAIMVLGLWFLFQIVNGMGMLGGEEETGVAYAAHIGGFIAGLILVKMFAPREALLKAKVEKQMR